MKRSDRCDTIFTPPTKIVFFTGKLLSWRRAPGIYWIDFRHDPQSTLPGLKVCQESKKHTERLRNKCSLSYLALLSYPSAFCRVGEGAEPSHFSKNGSQNQNNFDRPPLNLLSYLVVDPLHEIVSPRLGFQRNVEPPPLPSPWLSWRPKLVLLVLHTNGCSSLGSSGSARACLRQATTRR